MDNSKEFLLPNESSEANLNAYKRIFSWQLFMNRVYNRQFNFICTSTASDRMKNAINTKNSPFTKPASTSALPYLFIKMRRTLKVQWNFNLMNLYLIKSLV